MNGYIKSFLYLMLVISVLGMMSPSKEYDKYIKFFISLLFVISILSPIVTVIKREDISFLLNNNYISVNEFESRINQDSIDVNLLIKEEYQDKLQNNIMNALEKQYYIKSSVEVDINDDETSKYYGDIENIDVIINKKDINKKDRLKNYISKTYMLDIENINIRTGSV